jgi:hypothetical protein
MHPLKAAVLHHRLDEISALAADPSVQSDPEFALDLMRIAREMGNRFTITRVARLLPYLVDSIDARALLVDRLQVLAFNHFGGGSVEDAAHRLWVQVTEGTVEPFSRDRPDFVLTPELKEDVRFLFQHVDIQSEEQLVALSQVAGEA